MRCTRAAEAERVRAGVRGAATYPDGPGALDGASGSRGNRTLGYVVERFGCAAPSRVVCQSS